VHPPNKTARHFLWRAAVAFDNDALARDPVGAPIIRIIRIEIRGDRHHENEPNPKNRVPSISNACQTHN